MTSKEALERIKRSYRFTKACLGFGRPAIETEKAIEKIEKDLEILECFKKIDKKELKDFIETQIKYTLNENSWLSACNCDLEKEKPTQHLIKIKEWLENERISKN